jgi:protein phosphatase
VPARKRWTWLIVMVGVFVLMIAGGSFAGLNYLRNGYYIADDNGQVALFQGQPEGVLGFTLSEKASEQPNPPILLADLPTTRRTAVQKKIKVEDGGLSGAERTIESLRAAVCKWSLAAENDQVFIFQGKGQTGCQVKRDDGPENKPLKVTELPKANQSSVRTGIPVDSRQQAETMFQGLLDARDACKANRTADCPE